MLVTVHSELLDPNYYTIHVCERVKEFRNRGDLDASHGELWVLRPELLHHVCVRVHHGVSKQLL